MISRHEDWERAGRQVDEWFIRFRAEREARIKHREIGPPAFWSYENHRGNIAWRIAEIAADE